LAEPRVFSPDVVEKVIRLCRLLSDIRIHPFLGPRLVLKGGTALNLFHLGVRRLSVDADLNYIGALDAETTAIERLSILVALTAVAEGQGYRVIQISDAHASSACLLSYRNERGSQDSLKLEVNYMYRASLGEAEEKNADLSFAAPLQFRLVSFPELVGGKLVALLDRTAARDLYDAAALADIVDPHDPRMHGVFIAMAGVLPRAIPPLIKTAPLQLKPTDREPVLRGSLLRFPGICARVLLGRFESQLAGAGRISGR
jgi:hypothetical protein